MMIKKKELEKLNIDAVIVILNQGKTLLDSKYQAHVNTSLDFITQVLNKYRKVMLFYIS